MSIEAITDLLEAKQAQAEAKRREAELLDAEARGLQAALDALRQSTSVLNTVVGSHVAFQVKRAFVPHTSSSGHRRTSAGRQPGSVSNKWKRHLLDLRDIGDVFSKEDVARLVLDREQRVMKPSEIQRLFENFSRYGHVKIIDEGMYVIPEEAAFKFRATVRDEIDLAEDTDESEEIASVANSEEENQTFDLNG